ncbi:hypothetical protein SSPO_049280 [Streptomyces antimycoticus]|uniref:Uncharacterized protein n=1 Tax=Streptomyces antimycoticus TaxID=68175 RepID=A0A499UNU9_9ACTN|nr:hypothetical protein SSPO_049280 [Streptomyces antimycoticus]
MLLLAENDTRVEAGVRSTPGVFTLLRGEAPLRPRVISHFLGNPGLGPQGADEPGRGLSEYGETGGIR